MDQNSDRWALVEVFGKRRHVGRVAEVTLIGATFLQIEALQPDGQFRTFHYGAAAIFAIEEMSEQQARERMVPRWSWGVCSGFTSSPILPERCSTCGQAATEHRAPAPQLPEHEGEDFDDIPL